MYKILIIGLGSIGQRHCRILKKINKKFVIKSISQNKIRNIENIQQRDVKKFKPNYIIISNHTSKHLKYLNFINNELKNVKILVEKPLFHKMFKFKEKNNNKIFVGYNLRFHPIIDKIKSIISKEDLYFSSLSCYSYLPKWRKNISYDNSNSAKKKYGGGVLLELSHEIDLINYLFNIKKIHSFFNSKISNLKIDTDDILNLNVFCKKVKFCNLNINFFDNLNQRMIRIVGNNFSLEGDLLKNSLIIIKKKNLKIKKINFKKTNTYENLHRSILKNKLNNICNLSQGLLILKLISKIKNGKKKNF